MSAFCSRSSATRPSFCGNEKKTAPYGAVSAIQTALSPTSKRQRDPKVGADFKASGGAVTGCIAVAVVDEAEGKRPSFLRNTLQKATEALGDAEGRDRFRAGPLKRQRLPVTGSVAGEDGVGDVAEDDLHSHAGRRPCSVGVGVATGRIRAGCWAKSSRKRRW